MTRSDPESIHKEIVIMLDLERELLADTFTSFDLVYNTGQKMFGKLYVETKLPWMFGENAAAEKERTGKKQTIVGRLVDAYKKHTARKEAKDK